MDLAAKDTIATKSRLLGAKYVYAFLDFIYHCQLVALMNLTNVLSEKLCHSCFQNFWFQKAEIFIRSQETCCLIQLSYTKIL